MVGAGAVGSFYGAMLARAGHRVTLIGREAHMQAIATDGLHLDLAKSPSVENITLHTSTNVAVVSDADLILFCVKSTDSLTSAQNMAPHQIGRAHV